MSKNEYTCTYLRCSIIIIAASIDEARKEAARLLTIPKAKQSHIAVIPVNSAKG